MKKYIALLAMSVFFFSTLSSSSNAQKPARGKVISTGYSLSLGVPDTGVYTDTEIYTTIWDNGDTEITRKPHVVLGSSRASRVALDLHRDDAHVGDSLEILNYWLPLRQTEKELEIAKATRDPAMESKWSHIQSFQRKFLEDKEAAFLAAYGHPWLNPDGSSDSIRVAFRADSIRAVNRPIDSLRILELYFDIASNERQVVIAKATLDTASERRSLELLPVKRVVLATEKQTFLRAYGCPWREPASMH